MDVSNPNENVVHMEGPKGSQLIETLVTLTGLEQPAEQKAVQAELGNLIHEAGHSPEALTLDQLREAMLAYLETIHLAYEQESREEVSAGRPGVSEKLKLVSE